VPIPETVYVLGRGERGIYGEIYFPKRAAYQGAIFDALRYGYDENRVKRYFQDHAEELLQEFQDHPRLFDPRHYETAKPRRSTPSVEEARERFGMYVSPFKGWSTYSVDGVFFDREGRMYEEATQVVRLLFRFTSSFVEQAVAAGCGDVLRSILFWTIARQARLGEHLPWSRAEQTRFTAEHAAWPKRKRAFVRKHFPGIAREVSKWIDDVGLFVFGYLVRQFSERVHTERLEEQEIWATSFFNLTVSVVRRELH